MKTKQIGVITLTGGHTLMVGNTPTNIELGYLSEQGAFGKNVEIERFGLFESSTPNYTTYYPELSPEDLQPKDEEFINPVFRMLSEVIVSKGRPIDFSKRGVLKKSMNKLIGQTVNVDHETAIGNAIGTVSEVFWQDSYTTPEGIKVPAGINARLKIDGKSNPRLARGIMMNPPSIHSNSVTIRFAWEPSHKFDEPNEFYNKLGQRDAKGELIRCVVVDILAYAETSLVPHGADPFAKKLDKDGKIVNPGMASDNYKFSHDKPINAMFGMDYKKDTELDDEVAILSLSNNNNNNNTNTEEPMEIEELIQNLVSEKVFDETLTKENILDKLKAKYNDLSKEVETLTDSKKQLETEKADLAVDKDKLEGELESFKETQAEMEAHTNNTRKEALRFYKLSKGDKADQAIIDLIGEADLKTAGALLKQYKTETDGKFTAKCKKCNGTDIVRNSAIPSSDGTVHEGQTDEQAEFTHKSDIETRESLKSKYKKQSRIFNAQK